MVRVQENTVLVSASVACWSERLAKAAFNSCARSRTPSTRRASWTRGSCFSRDPPSRATRYISSCRQMHLAPRWVYQSHCDDHSWLQGPIIWTICVSEKQSASLLETVETNGWALKFGCFKLIVFFSQFFGFIFYINAGERGKRPLRIVCDVFIYRRKCLSACHLGRWCKAATGHVFKRKNEALIHLSICYLEGHLPYIGAIFRYILKASCWLTNLSRT